MMCVFLPLYYFAIVVFFSHHIQFRMRSHKQGTTHILLWSLDLVVTQHHWCLCKQLKDFDTQPLSWCFVHKSVCVVSVIKSHSRLEWYEVLFVLIVHFTREDVCYVHHCREWREWIQPVKQKTFINYKNITII